MFVRPTAFRRPSSPEEGAPPAAAPDPREQPAEDGLTRAEAHALSRCAPLTPTEFKERRRAADQGLLSLRGVLAGDKDARRR